jgi:acyl homoserine lactone synthase
MALTMVATGRAYSGDSSTQPWEIAMYQVIISHAFAGDLSPALRDSMHVLRRKVFLDRLGWSVHCDKDGRERDVFDTLDPLYLVACEPEQPSRALGCWRLLPSTGPYMLRDVFPELLGGQPAPDIGRVWEISRFAIDMEAGGGTFGFSLLPALMLRSLVRHAATHGIESIVGVTTVAVERMLRKLGFEVERYAPPRRIGSVMSVGFCLPMSRQVQLRVCGCVFEACPEPMALSRDVMVRDVALELRA